MLYIFVNRSHVQRIRLDSESGLEARVAPNVALDAAGATESLVVHCALIHRLRCLGSVATGRVIKYATYLHASNVHHCCCRRPQDVYLRWPGAISGYVEGRGSAHKGSFHTVLKLCLRPVGLWPQST